MHIPISKLLGILLAFPIGFAKFGNTYRVVSASPELSRFLGARVLKVGDTPVEHAAELLFQMLAQDENPPLAEAFIGDGLTTGAELHGLGIIPDTGIRRNTRLWPMMEENLRSKCMRSQQASPTVN